VKNIFRSKKSWAIAGVICLLGTLGAGCSSEEPCEPRRVVVTDIDETLTTGDGEWVLQIVNPDHDPAMRPDADRLMKAYFDRGYRVVYITARGDEVELTDGTSAFDATRDWLVDHGFPYAEEDLFLFPGLMGEDEETVAYKAGVIEQLVEEGWTVDYAYGNADTDIEAFLRAGVPNERVFLVGRLAGTLEVEPITDEEAFTDHIEEHLPAVEDAACD
jgi:phosphatidate phosphatase PAH1